jgi:beta-galactosidase
LERTVDLAGLDVYVRRHELAGARRAARYLAGNSRLPVVMEAGCGGFPWWMPLSWDDNRAALMTLLMHGVRGFNLYMLVEREQWFGSPIGRDGSRREGPFLWIGELVRQLRDTALLERDMRVPVGLVRVRDYERLTQCTSLVDPAPPMALDLLGLGPAELCSDVDHGLEGPVALEYAQLVEELEAALDRLRLPYRIIDSEADSEQLAACPLLVVPSFDFMDQGFLERLRAYVAGGGRLLLTPRLPGRDAGLRPLEVELPEHRLVSAAGLADALADEAERLPARSWPTADAEEVELVARLGDSQPPLLFVANRSRAPIATALEGVQLLDPGYRGQLWDALTGEPVAPERVRLEAGEVRMLRFRRIDEAAAEAHPAGAPPASGAGGSSGPSGQGGAG